MSILRTGEIRDSTGNRIQFGPKHVTTFGASGVWTKPTWCTKITVRVIGAGGGSCGYAESGGGGGYSEMIILNPPNSAQVTIGIGGQAVAYYGTGGAGGTSSFGTYCSATGGYGANSNVGHTGGVGGSGSGGQINVWGGGATGHTNGAGSNPSTGGMGGSSYLSGSAASDRTGAYSPGTIGVRRAGPGAGGTGGSGATGWYGTNGENGMIIVWEWK